MLQDVVGQWSSAQIHDTVAAIARQPIYAPLRQSLAGRALRYIFERIADLLDLFRGSGNARFVLIAAVVVVVLTVVARIVVSTQADERRRRVGGSVHGAGAGRTDFWAAARDLAAAGDYTAACHALYAGVLDSLSRAGALRFHSSKTSGDYARELRRRGSPAVQDFGAFARQCDRVIYGTSEPTAADYDSVSKAAERAVRAVVAA